MYTGILQFLFLVGLLVPVVLFLITQQDILKSIQPQNRTIEPGEVWLQLIPLFGMVWQYVVVSRIATSIRNEMAVRTASFSFEATQVTNYKNLPKPTCGIGIVYCIFINLSILPRINMIAATAALICWIIYWVKLNDYKNQLQLKTI